MRSSAELNALIREHVEGTIKAAGGDIHPDALQYIAEQLDSTSETLRVGSDEWLTVRTLAESIRRVCEEPELEVPSYEYLPSTFDVAPSPEIWH